MTKVTIKSIIKTSIVTALTIATAFIWKDVIIETIELFLPPREELFYKFIAAVLSTVLVIITIYAVLKTESKAEVVIKRFKHKKKKI
jgi:VanZ family protein